MIRKQNLY